MSVLRIAVVGLGTIGGSLCAALRAAGHHVTGYDRENDITDNALQRGIVDIASHDAGATVASAEVVVLATPIGAIIDQLASVTDQMAEGAVLIDTGSSKVAVVGAMNAITRVACIGGHPIAGSDRSPPESWDDSLFRDRTFILTRTQSTTPEIEALGERMAADIGARPYWMEAGEHDDLIATTSHLPILLAITMTRRAGETLNHSEHGALLIGGQLRSVTRMADAPAEMLADILRFNHDCVLSSFDEFVREAYGLLDSAQKGSLLERLDGLAPTRRRLIQ